MKWASAHAGPIHLYAVILGGLPGCDSRFDIFEQTHGFPFLCWDQGAKKAPAIFAITKTTDALSAQYSVFVPADLVRYRQPGQTEDGLPISGQIWKPSPALSLPAGPC